MPALVSGLWVWHLQAETPSEVLLLHGGNLPVDCAIILTRETDHCTSVCHQKTGEEEAAKKALSIRLRTYVQTAFVQISHKSTVNTVNKCISKKVVFKASAHVNSMPPISYLISGTISLRLSRERLQHGCLRHTPTAKTNQTSLLTLTGT